MKELREGLDQLKSQLHFEREGFVPLWREAADFVLPRKADFFRNRARKGDRRNDKILDSTAVIANSILASGMMTGITSPAREWKKLTVEDPDVAELGPVKEWLYQVNRRMDIVFTRSNLYNVLPSTYQSIAAFSNAAILVEPDDDTVVRFYPFPIGSYYLAQNSKLQVDTFVREFFLSAKQVVEKFAVDPDDPTKIDWENISSHVKDAWDNDRKEQLVGITHVIRPNPNYNPNKAGSKFKKFSSVYYEDGGAHAARDRSDGSNDYQDKILSMKGFDVFPVLAPRWDVTAEDPYGTGCPAEVAIGDIKQLILGEKKSLQAIEKIINPPMMGDISLKNQKVSMLPGGLSWAAMQSIPSPLRPVHEINSFRINEHEAKQAQKRDAVNRAFYTDIILTNILNSRAQPATATEIQIKEQEKLLVFGPLLEQLNEGLLDPLIENTFHYMEQAGLIPEPPKEIQGQRLKVEYVSIMAQAQKFIGLGGIERFTGFMANLSQFKPEVWDKVDADEMSDLYGDMTGIPPSIIRSQEEINDIRQGRADMQAQQMEAQQAAMGAKTAKDLSQTEVTENNALRLLQGEQ